MRQVGSVGPAGALAVARMPRDWPDAQSLRHVLAHALPWPGCGREVNLWRLRNLRNVWRGLWRLAAARALGLPHFYGALWLDVYRADGSRVPLGLASLRLVTNTGAGYLVDALQNIVEAENQKFHGFGTGSNAEAAGDSALQTELTTEYAVDNTRPTGSQAEASAQVYRTVGTLAPDSGGTIPVTEHGVLSQAAVGGGGVLLDRSKFAAVNVVAGADSLQATYDFTINSGN